MIIHRPLNPNGVYVVMDQQTKYDAEVSEYGGAPTVGAGFAFARAAVGREWERCTRIALYPYEAKPKPKERAAARAAYRELLSSASPKAVIVFPTPAKHLKQKNTVQGTQVWKDLGPPDSMDDMRGTTWRRGESYIIPTWYPIGTIGQVNLAMQARWMRMALELAKGSEPLTPPRICIHPDQQMLDKLGEMYQSLSRPIAVDIETIPDTDRITAIGVSDGVRAVSVPWDEFEAACGSGLSPALSAYGLGSQIRSALTRLLQDGRTYILHNGVFDVPQLRKRGILIQGPMEDTLAMHATNYPELRHGLQLACATEFCVPPWKSLFHPKGVKRDEPKFWYWEPEAMRDYNAKDAFYTWHLAKHSAWKCGVEL